MIQQLRNRRSITIQSALVVGLSLLGAGLFLWWKQPVQAMPHAQTTPPNLNAQYIGSGTCGMCHTEDDVWHLTSHAHMVKLPGDDTILGDLTATEALTITWPDGSKRPVTQEDITFVLGGRYMQRYVSVLEQPDGTSGYYVLPVQWNVPQIEEQAGTWTSYHTEDWMTPERDWRVACAGCHATGLDGAAASETTDFVFVEAWRSGAVELNIGCEACHGPGSEHMANPEAIVRTPDATVCGQCHVQGHDPSGEHGYPVGYQPGLALDDTLFELAGLDDESVWWPTGHARAYNEYGEWLNSPHAQSKALSPECARCHGTLPDSTDPAPDEDTLTAGATDGITCVACHNPHPAEGTTEGSTMLPAMLKADSYTLCVTCHNSTAPDGSVMVVGSTIHHPAQEMFEGQKVVDAVAGIPSGHFRAEDGPSCVDCHMPATVQIGEYGRVGSHSMATVLGSDGEDGQTDSCTVCHTDLSPTYIQQFIQDAQTGVSDRLAVANQALEDIPDASPWVSTVLAFITNDGSLGVHNYSYTDALLNAVEVELGLVTLEPITSPAFVVVQNPEICAECHRDEFQRWQASPHANASTKDVFLQEFAAQGRPNYCMSCHASGYNSNTGEYSFEGVVCGNCHLVTGDTQHPPAPVEMADAPADCGRCHSGAHAPTYEEWLVTSHKSAGIDCVDCHTPHNNGLLLGDVNSTCGDCHQEAVMDRIHMGENMTCVDCHMDRQVSQNGLDVRTTGHTMDIDPGTCAGCHGNTHLLSEREPEQAADPDQVQELKDRIQNLEEKVDENWNSGVVGGALGALILVFVLFLMMRLRSVR